jgi:hypothetical protein
MVFARGPHCRRLPKQSWLLTAYAVSLHSTALAFPAFQAAPSWAFPACWPAGSISRPLKSFCDDYQAGSQGVGEAKAFDESSLMSVEDVSLLLPSFYEHEGKQHAYESAHTRTMSPYPSKLHNVHVVSFLTSQQAAVCLALANDYAARTGRWDRPDFDRHAAYATCDFPVDDCGPLRRLLDDLDFDRRLFQLMSDRYGVPSADLDLLDLFCAHYRAESASNDAGSPGYVTETMDRLEPHRDGSLLSCTVLLSPPADFSGGGTFFDALRDEPVDLDRCLHPGGVVRPKREGCAVLHTGKALHGADVVVAGNRTVLVGFVNVAERWQRRGALAAACRDWGRMDVARWRYDRQVARAGTGENATRGWRRTNQPWLPKCGGRSDIRSYCPSFGTVRKRAYPEFQRLYRLRAEDRLLRTVLLDEPAETTDEELWIDRADLPVYSFPEGWQVL